MDVGVDKPGDHVLAVQIEGLGTGRYREARPAPHREDPLSPDEQRHIGARWAPSGVDDGDSGQRNGVLRR